MTGETKGEIKERQKIEMVNVFVPTTPNPTSGFLLFIPKDDIVRLDMSVEDAIKLVVSARNGGSTKEIISQFLNNRLQLDF